MAVRDCFEAMERPFDTIRLIGGGARSAFWSRMLADVTGHRVEVPEGEEFGARGAALLAATGTGRFASVREASRQTFALARSYEPDERTRGAYERAYQRYGVCRDAFLDKIAKGSA